MGAATAWWLGNTTLNPAVLVFMTFVLSWKFTVLRIVLGLILVFGASQVANWVAGKDKVTDAEAVTKYIDQHQPSDEGSFGVRWLKAIVKMLISIVPAYVISVLVLGAVRAWLFPAIPGSWANSIVVTILFAIAGTLFVIPTAGEIPVVQTLLGFGLGFGPAAALMFSLPAISLPSMLMVRKSLPVRVLVFLVCSVAVLAIVGALVAAATF